ncbi:nitrate- and nitrite sensing domain-containing protein [Plantactinospora sp. B5E13]|uniref:sensor histidine kinase n=1 Tax=unclassified Plantactinospora TaxID=2631981 RepID=UPI00325F60FC
MMAALRRGLGDLGRVGRRLTRTAPVARPVTDPDATPPPTGGNRPAPPTGGNRPASPAGGDSAGDPVGTGRPDRTEGTASPVTAERLRRFTAAVLVVLVLLWGYGAFLATRDAMDLLALRTLAGRLGQPTETLLLDLQAERRLTVVELAAPGRHRDALAAQRSRTDNTIGKLRRFVQDGDLRLLTAGAARDRAAELVRQLETVRPLREDIDRGGVDRATVAASYAGLIDAGFAVYGAQWTSRHLELTEQTRPLVALARSIELLAREDTLVAGALAANLLTATEHAQFAELVVVQRFARGEAVAGLSATERASYERMTTGPVLTRLRVVEEQLLTGGRAGTTPEAGTGRPPVGAAEWQAAVEPALAELRGLVSAGVRHSVEQAAPGAAGVVVQVGLVGGLGLVLVVGTVVLAFRAARRLVDDLDRLGTEHTALRTSRDELASRVAVQAERAGRLAAQAAQLSTQRRQLAAQREQLVAQTVRRQAQTDRATERTAQVAARLAAYQRAREVFVRLTRENQTLLHRQIGLLDTLERRETDTEALAELFRLDHLATRIRRNVEQLISFSGGTPGRRWRRPVPLIDVVRGAVAEVSDYARVLVAPNWSGEVAGRALPDLIHLLAEVVETALASSPPTTTVRIAGERRGGAEAIVVSDDGVGRGPAELATLNTLIRDTPTDSPLHGMTGLYVVGRLARRHGITVELAAGPRGGTATTVLIPATLLVRTADLDPTDPPADPDRANAGSDRPDPPEGTGDTVIPADTGVGHPGDPTRPGDGPDALPVRVRQPHLGPSAGVPTGATGPHQNGAPARPAEPDWSMTIELPVTLPTPIGDQPTSSERTTGDSRPGHDG